MSYSYIIEGGIDFYSMLNDEPMISNDIVNNNDDSNICLISNTKLTSNAIKLSCGHAFNYESIYKEVSKQKINRSVLEVVKLKEYQLKCPYCRTIQDKLLPFLKLPGIRKIFGVNHPPHKTMCNNTCNYHFKTGKNKGKSCDTICFFECCNTHQSIIEKKKLKNESITIKSTNNISSSSSTENKTVKQLHEIAKGMNIKKYYKMKKMVLLEAIQSNQNSNIVIDPK